MSRSPIPTLAVAPTLPALPREMLARLPVSALVEFRCQLRHALADVEAALALRDTTPGAPPSASAEDLLDVTEAAKRLRMSRTWVYRHADAFPFTVRLDGALRFDPRGIAAWLANHHRGGGASA
jgi:predicted DNA-binding transcriptional regulator AlpA